MTKVAKVQANPIAIAIDTYTANPAKSVAKMVADALSAYAKTAIRLHYTACFVLFHAAETGDVRPMNTFFKGLRQNDADAFRIWVGKHVTFTVVDEKTQEESEARFIGFTKAEGGFKVRKGSDAVRVGFFNVTDLLNGKSFMDIDQDAERKPVGLAEILASLARIEKQMTKKAEENDVTLPDSIKSLLTNITNTAQSVGNTLGATKH